MTRHKDPDHFDWFGALKGSSEQARELRDSRPMWVVTTCRCGAVESQGRETGTKADLRDEGVTVVRCEGLKRCRACPHAIHHGAMCVQHHFTATSTVRDYYHPECVEM